jgi:hypothetical protein
LGEYSYEESEKTFSIDTEDYGRKPVGESVPAVGWKLLKDEIL